MYQIQIQIQLQNFIHYPAICTDVEDMLVIGNTYSNIQVAELIDCRYEIKPFENQLFGSTDEDMVIYILRNTCLETNEFAAST